MNYDCKMNLDVQDIHFPALRIAALTKTSSDMSATADARGQHLHECLEKSASFIKEVPHDAGSSRSPHEGHSSHYKVLASGLIWAETASMQVATMQVCGCPVIFHSSQHLSKDDRRRQPSVAHRAAAKIRFSVTGNDAPCRNIECTREGSGGCTVSEQLDSLIWMSLEACVASRGWCETRNGDDEIRALRWTKACPTGKNGRRWTCTPLVGPKTDPGVAAAATPRWLRGAARIGRWGTCYHESGRGAAVVILPVRLRAARGVSAAAWPQRSV
jgi:hypothetical protein